MPALIRLLAPLAFLAAIVSACTRSSAVPQDASTSANSAEPAASTARAVVRAFGSASPETIRLSPDLASEPQEPQPTIDYSTARIARDSIESMVRRSVGPANSAIRVSGGPVRFKYLYAADSVDGWAFHIDVTDTSACPDSRVQSALREAGWAPSYGYSADGPDGSVMGFVSKRFLCVVDGHWDGGDDSDSTYLPEPGCQVTVTCVPRREDDVPQR